MLEGISDVEILDRRLTEKDDSYRYQDHKNVMVSQVREEPCPTASVFLGFLEETSDGMYALWKLTANRMFAMVTGCLRQGFLVHLIDCQISTAPEGPGGVGVEECKRYVGRWNAEQWIRVVVVLRNEQKSLITFRGM